MTLVLNAAVTPMLSSGQGIGALVGLVCFLVVTIDAWRSPAATGSKVLWTILAFFCTLLTLIVWFVWGRRKAYGTA